MKRASKTVTARRTSTAENETKASRRPIWTGSIAFGLVQIPVSLVSAEKSHELSFHQLDGRDMAAIGYERVNKVTGKKVEWGDIVKGYEIAKGKFVVVDDDDFEKANVAATQTIDIQDFVDAREISPSYYERPYYLVPGKRGSKAYALLRDALVQKGLVAVALVVIRTRQHLCAVLPDGDALVLELLRFEHELRPVSDASIGKVDKATPKEMKLAEQLIEGMVAKWEPRKYKDTYTDDLLAAIKEKAASGTIAPRNEPAQPRTAGAVDLVSLLERSLSSTKKRQKTGKRKAA